MQSKLINLSEIINDNVSCENNDHRHRKPYRGNFFAIINPSWTEFMMALPTAASDSHGWSTDFASDFKQ